MALSGSPAITATLSAAETQNAPLAAAVGCAASDGSSTAAEVAHCLRYNATPEAISYGHVPVNTTWQEYDPLSWGLPEPEYYNASTGGAWPLPAVVIVDGDFIPQALSAALAAGVNAEVAMYVSNVGEEDDLAPNIDFATNKTNEQVLQFVNQQLAPWGRETAAGGGGADPSFGANLLKQYFSAALDAGHPQQAYLQISGQIGTACGQIHLVQQAHAGGSVGRQLHYAVLADGPSHPQVLGVAAEAGYTSHYAYHQVDLLWAMESWDWFPNFTGEPTNYAPTADDRAQAALLRRIYIGFANGSTTPGGIPPFRSGEVAGYTVGSIGKKVVTPVSNWQAAFCAAVQKAGLWDGFWWKN